MRDSGFRAAILLASLLLLLGSSSGEKIHLDSRSFQPEEKKPSEVSNGGALNILGDGSEKRYMLLQFSSPSSRKQRYEISSMGVKFMSYIPENAWIIEIDSDRVRKVLRRKKVRYLGSFQPRDRISSFLLKKYHSDVGSTEVEVRFFPGTDSNRERGVLTQHGTISEKVSKDRWILNTSYGELMTLARNKIVKSISIAPPKREILNDGSRKLIDVETLQKPPYNLNGSGFTAAIWDGGWAGNHADLNGSGKRIVGDSGGSCGGCTIKDHGTHVAGTMLGSGELDNTYRGMAPESQVATYEWPDSTSELFSETDEALNSYSSILSQNSWGWSIGTSNTDLMGNYGGMSSDYDSIISNETSSVSSVIPIVFAAGNEGNDWSFRYNTTTGPGATAKNTLTVGAVDGTKTTTSFSSWGPTDDGRIKPDVVTDGYSIYSTLPGNNYGYMSGTSMAAPAASGALILLNQQFKRVYGRLPDPATSKGLMIQTAEDLNRTGPDYITGWGLVNATDAVNYINRSDDDNLIRIGRLDKGQKDNYTVRIPEGKSVKLTLIWSDYPGDSSSAKALVNDLDLVVTNSTGHRFYPWTLNWSIRKQEAIRTKEDHRNPVEQVYISNSNSTKLYVTVNGSNIPQPSQSYSLLLTRKLGDTAPPNLTVHTPENTSYTSTPEFNLSSNEDLLKAIFSIDSGVNNSMKKRSSQHFYNKTREVSDGVHKATFYGKDTDGNWSSESVVFTVDSGIPSLSPEKPVKYANISGSFTVNATWSDPNSIKSAEFRIINSSGTQINGSLNSSVDGSNLADGDYTVLFNVTDEYGNSATSSRSITVDNSAPVFTSSQPGKKENISGIFSISASWNDVSGVKKTYFSIKNSSGVHKSGNLNTTVDSRNFESGDYTISFNLTDYAGNSREKFVNVTFDNKPPSLMNRSPTAGSTVSGDFNIEATWSDAETYVESAMYNLTNSSGSLHTGTLNASFNSRNLSDGNYTIIYLAQDSLGNVEKNSISITVDNPLRPRIKSPKQANYSSTPDFNLSAAENVEKAIFSIDGGENRSMDNSSQRFFYNTSTVIGSGDHSAKFYGKDIGGSWVSEKVFFTVDKVSPAVNPVSPGAYANISGISVIEASASDFYTAVNSTDFVLKNASGLVASGDLNATINTTLYSDGSYTLKFYAEDWVGNTGEVTRTLTMDNSPPVFRSSSPVNGAEVSGTTSIKSGWLEDVSGVEMAVYRIKNSSGVLSSGDLNATVDTATYTDGTYTLIFNLSDYAGNSNLKSVDVVFDNTDPVLTPQSPSEGETVTGDFTVSASYSDSTTSVSAASFYVSNSTGTQATGNIGGTVDISGLEDGNYNVTFYAEDAAGNTVTKENQITLDKPVDIAIISPKNQIYRKTPDFNVTGNKNLQNAVFSIDSGVNNSMTQSSAEKFFNDTLTVIDGIHEARFHAESIEGGWDSENISFKIDTTKPSLQILRPERLANISSLVRLEATWSDETTSVNSADYLIENSSGSVTGDNLNDSIGTDLLEDGTYNISFTITDQAGNTREKKREIRVDTSPPDIHAFSPTQGDNISSTLDVEAVTGENISGLKAFNYSLENSSSIQASGAVNDTVSTSNLEPGNYSLVFQAEDFAGNSDTREITFFVDNMPPDISNLNPSMDNNLSGTATVNFSASDHSGVESRSYRWRNDSGNVTSWLNPGDFHTGNLSDGNYSIEVRAIDALGNTGTGSVSGLTVDNSGPGMTVSMNGSSSYSGSWLGEAAEFRVDCGADISDISGSSVSVEGEEIGDSSSQSAVFTLNRSGNLSYSFSCTDGAGNTGETERRIAIDSSPPKVTGSDPAQDSTVPTSPQILIDFKDEAGETGINISSSSVETSQGELENLSWGNSSLEVMIENLDHSTEFTITGTVEDRIGNADDFQLSYTTGAERTDTGQTGGSSSGGGTSASTGTDSSDDSLSATLQPDQPGEFQVKDSTPVESMSVSGNGEVEISVSETSPEYNEPRSTESYTSLDISVETGDIRDMNVTFTVNTSWIQRNDYSRSSVKLYRRNKSSWQELDTYMQRQTQQKIYYIAEVPGFSTFTIAATPRQQTSVQPEQTEPETLEGTNRSLGERQEEKKNGSSGEKKAKDEKSGSGFPLIPSLLLLLVIGAGGAGGGYLYLQKMQEQELRDEVEELRKAAGSQAEARSQIIQVEQAINNSKYEEAENMLEDVKNRMKQETRENRQASLQGQNRQRQQNNAGRDNQQERGYSDRDSGENQRNQGNNERR